ncbi:hypothetical protein M2650_16280 [Luteimonas sp. SX5]|uniref:Poly(Hydroxyalcanoate) granule associated protein n=1 Tax=Luteimonas galliterrae TaxID=2940486 RepID=A0ABT0MMS9_9GAMM|nr:hypothetical protein [Luteimonas galliterrae]MCL1636179.1 hypothetical protein [Luteimonas galliterrae]
MSDLFVASYVSAAETERAAEAKSNLGNGGGWLRAIALALGKIADAMGERMLDMARDIDTLQRKQKDDPNATIDGKGLTELNAELQVLGQQLGQMLQMLATIVKTIGEGNKDISRKQ